MKTARMDNFWDTCLWIRGKLIRLYLEENIESIKGILYIIKLYVIYELHHKTNDIPSQLNL